MSENLYCAKCNMEYPNDNETLHCCICKMNHYNGKCMTCDQFFTSGQHCCVCKWSGPTFHSFVWHSTLQGCN